MRWPLIAVRHSPSAPAPPRLVEDDLCRAAALRPSRLALFSAARRWSVFCPSILNHFFRRASARASRPFRKTEIRGRSPVACYSLSSAAVSPRAWNLAPPRRPARAHLSVQQREIGAPSGPRPLQSLPLAGRSSVLHSEPIPAYSRPPPWPSSVVPSLALSHYPARDLGSSAMRASRILIRIRQLGSVLSEGGPPAGLESSSGRWLAVLPVRAASANQ